jgi:hypothetical protein
MAAVEKHYDRRLFGPPDGSLVFDSGRSPLPYRAPAMIDVPYWGFPDAVLTRFATNGMCEVPLVDGARVELHLSVPLLLDDAGRWDVSTFLSSLAAYPYCYETDLKPGQFLTDIESVPCFPEARGVLFQDLDVRDPADLWVDGPEGVKIRLLRAIPVSPEEIEELRRRDVGARMQEL